MVKKEKKDIIELPDDQLRKAIGNHIKIARKQKITLTIEAVAKKIKLSRASLTQIENGKTNITAVNLWKLACLLETSVTDFFPRTPKGFGLGKKELANIAKEDQRAVGWAKELFGTEKGGK